MKGRGVKRFPNNTTNVRLRLVSNHMAILPPSPYYYYYYYYHHCEKPSPTCLMLFNFIISPILGCSSNPFFSFLILSPSPPLNSCFVSLAPFSKVSSFQFLLLHLWASPSVLITFYCFPLFRLLH